MRIFLCVLIILISFSLQAIEHYPDLKKVIKNSTFTNDKGKSYSIEDIKDINNTLLIIWNHGSISDNKKDKCLKNAEYEWDGGVVPTIKKLHNKKINGLTIKIYKLCSGVKGMLVKNQKKYRKIVKSGKKITLKHEYKNIKRQNIILDKINQFEKLGFKNIILAGHSAGAWASLNLQSRFPNKIKGTIALNPAFAGWKQEWQHEYPEWGAFRENEINIIKKSNNLNAILFSHENDKFEDPETLSFFKDFNKLQFINYSHIDPTTCYWPDVDKKMKKNDGHSLDQTKCFEKYIEENNYFIKFLEDLF